MTATPDTRRWNTLYTTLLKRGVFLVVGAIALYLLSPRILEVFAEAPDLRRISPLWFGLMFVLETGSLVAAWGLSRVAVPGLSWLAAATSQLGSNAASKVFPGGAVFGGAVYFRMLATAGTDPGNAAAALAVNSIISTGVLLALPAFAAVGALLTAPVPDGLVPVALGAFVMFCVLFGAGFLLVRFDGLLAWATRTLGGLVSWVARLFKRTVHVSPEYVLGKRDEVLDAVGPRWWLALVYAALNWLLDYLVLLAALYAVGAPTRFSVALLAWAASAVLAMIPITPGGLGFVEAGLSALLVLAGVPAEGALQATLAYRLFSFWLPIPIGGVAYWVHRRRFGVTVGGGQSQPDRRNQR